MTCVWGKLFFSFDLVCAEMKLRVLLEQLVSAGVRGWQHGREACQRCQRWCRGVCMAPFLQGSCVVSLLFSINMERKISLLYPSSGWRNRWKRQIKFLPKACKGRIYAPPPHQLYLKIKINQISFGNCLIGQVTDSVFDVSSNSVGSLRHSCHGSGVMPGIQHISGLPGHLLDYLFIFRVFDKKILREREKRKNCVYKSGKSNLENSEVSSEISKYILWVLGCFLGPWSLGSDNL